jgi:hypothetical protein
LLFLTLPKHAHRPADHLFGSIAFKALTLRFFDRYLAQMAKNGGVWAEVLGV